MLKPVIACAAALCLALAARANDVEDVSRLLKEGQRNLALERVNKALEEKPRDPQARFLKGVILTEQGKSKEAMEIFGKLTQDYPELPEPYNNLAVIYAGQGEYDKARTALEQSIRAHPSYATAYENLGDLYANLASQAYGKALQIDSSNASAQNKLSLVRELMGAAAPVPAPAKPEPVSDPTADILKAVNSWAQAWSRKDVAGYLAHYAKDFHPPGDLSRAHWESARRARIEAPHTIAVEIGSPKVTMQGNDTALVVFQQTYRSDRFNGTSTKTLTMVKSNGRWLIREEKVG
ncbi:MAG TPA: tetratricopeptide repeat protein [Burkholderiales bacterium]|nr:tetratricopeptide repeat protein [Burkholderiales bacterium]